MIGAQRARVTTEVFDAACLLISIAIEWRRRDKNEFKIEFLFFNCNFFSNEYFFKPYSGIPISG